MRNISKISILTCLFIFASALLSGAYLRFQPVQLSQPDGSKLELYASGDEFYNWLHDKDGYTVKQNDRGYYVYMINATSDELIFTEHIAGQADPANLNLVPWANISPEMMGQLRTKAQNQYREIGSGRTPSTGTLNNISIFIRFSDQTEFGQNLSTYNSMFNGSTGNTMQSYFLEASYNALNISTSFYPTPSTTVVSWQDSHPRAYYQPYSTTNTVGYSGDSQRTDREFTLLVNAVNGVSSQIPSSLIVDADNDGKVDNVCFIIKGGSDGWAELLWPHRWSLYNRYVYINSKRVYDFNFQLSDFLASSGVGVICHEMFHSLSAPDLYHYTSNGISPAGPWDIMEQNANPPQHMGAYMKYKYGHWISSIPTISSGTHTLNPLTSSTGQSFRINSPNSSSEYFIVEFRKKTGTFENSLPGSGMLIYRINPAYDGNADGPPDEVYIFRPGGSTTANGTINSANFSTQTGRTSFSNTTNPYGFLTDGTLGDISISSIGSSAGSTMTFTFNVNNAPTDLSGDSSGGTVSLNWQAPQAVSPSSYKVYRNSAYLASSTALNYTDTAVTNGQTYTYHVTAVFTSPASESGPSNTVSVTANNNISTILGSGVSFTSTQEACPINIYYKSLHGQSVYTLAELNAAGIYGPKDILQLGFNVSTAPSESMPDFIVRMKNTTATNASNWLAATDMTTVYTNASYMPATGDYDMLTFSTPFTWDGTSNIVIDTAFNQTANWNASGMTQYTSVTNGYRYIRNDGSDQSNIFSGGSTSSYRPNVKLTFAGALPAPEIVLTPSSLNFGAIAVGSNSILQFTIQNAGDETLTGSIVTPTGYSVALSTRAEDKNSLVGTAKNALRNTLGFTIPAGSSANYRILFRPTAASSYNSNIVITSNDPANPTVNFALIGSGYIQPTISLNNTALNAQLHIGGTATQTFTISNSGSQVLNYGITESPVVAWFTASPVLNPVAAGGNQVITCSFNAAGLNPGLYQSTLQITSNDPANPLLVVSLNLEVLNYTPTINIPESFTFNMNGSLVVNFSSCVSDQDGQNLTLGYSNNANVLVSIDAMMVTFTANEGWSGSENLNFSVYDGYAYAYDTANVVVNFVNTPPTIDIPAEFSFDMNGSLQVDFTAYVDDIDAQDLSLAYGNNSNVLVSIDGMMVTFTAADDWFGTENLSFSVYDGYAYAYDTADVVVNFVNTPPTISLPVEFSFDMNGSLQVDFTAYVDDIDAQDLSLAYGNNSNVLVSIDGMMVTFSAMYDWSGSEELSFTVSDGIDETTDNVPVTVNLIFLEQPEIAAITTTAETVAVGWDTVPNASLYEIYRSSEPYGTYTLIATTDQNFYEDLDSLPMAFYKIIAVDGTPRK